MKRLVVIATLLVGIAGASAQEKDTRLQEQAARNKQLNACIASCKKSRSVDEGKKCDLQCREVLGCSIGRAKC